MFKKLKILILAMALVILAFPFITYASGIDAVYSRDTISTEQFLVNITRPESSESTFSRNYIICGNTQKTGIRVKILIFNMYSGVYETYKNENGYFTFDIGNSGMFMKEVQLPDEGANLVRVVAYNRNIPLEKLERGKNLQVSNFTVTLLNSEIRDVIIGMPNNDTIDGAIGNDILSFPSIFRLFSN